MKICKICGREYEPHHWNQKCCSPKCSKLNMKQLQKQWEIDNRDRVRQRRHKRYLRSKDLKIDMTPPCGRASCFDCTESDCSYG